MASVIPRGKVLWRWWLSGLPKGWQMGQPTRGPRRGKDVPYKKSSSGKVVWWPSSKPLPKEGKSEGEDAKKARPLAATEEKGESKSTDDVAKMTLPKAQSAYKGASRRYEEALKGMQSKDTSPIQKKAHAANLKKWSERRIALRGRIEEMGGSIEQAKPKPETKAVTQKQPTPAKAKPNPKVQKAASEKLARQLKGSKTKGSITEYAKQAFANPDVPQKDLNTLAEKVGVDPSVDKPSRELLGQRVVKALRGMGEEEAVSLFHPSEKKLNQQTQRIVDAVSRVKDKDVRDAFKKIAQKTNLKSHEKRQFQAKMSGLSKQIKNDLEGSSIPVGPAIAKTFKKVVNAVKGWGSAFHEVMGKLFKPALKASKGLYQKMKGVAQDFWANRNKALEMGFRTGALANLGIAAVQFGRGLMNVQDTQTSLTFGMVGMGWLLASAVSQKVSEYFGSK